MARIAPIANDSRGEKHDKLSARRAKTQERAEILLTDCCVGSAWSPLCVLAM